MDGEGCVVVAGIFPAGTVCRCVSVVGPEVQRPENGFLVGVRTVDDAGFVGFSGLEVGASYFVSGYTAEGPVDVRVKGHTLTELNEFLSQAPVQAQTQAVGHLEQSISTGASVAGAENPPPAVSDLPSGVPADVAAAAGLPTGVEAQEVPTLPRGRFYAYTGPEPEPTSVDAPVGWVKTDKQAPSVPGSPAQHLWEWTGDGDVPVSELWSLYEGPLEDVSADTSSTDAPANTEEVASGVASTPAAAVSSSSQAQSAGTPEASVREQLLVQASTLSVPNAASLDEAELRQSIIDKGSTPVA